MVCVVEMSKSTYFVDGVGGFWGTLRLGVSTESAPQYRLQHACQVSYPPETQEVHQQGDRNMRGRSPKHAASFER